MSEIHWNSVCDDVDGAGAGPCSDTASSKQSKDNQALHEVQQIFVNDEGLPCPKCKSRATTFFTVCTRSADEGKTAKFKCKVCFAQWNLYS